MPHVYCLRIPEVIWLYVAANAAIALAYFFIPPLLVYFVRKRRDIAFSWVFVLFGIFIMACGTTHVLDIVTLWVPIYRFADVVLVITAIASAGTAFVLLKVMPEALLLPNPQQLRDEIEKRKQAQQELEQLNQLLEHRVLERTATLNASNAELEVSLQELRYQLELNRAITTQAGDSILLTDETGQISFLNPEGERTLGYAAEQILGHSLRDVLLPEGRSSETGTEETNPLLHAATGGHVLRDWSGVFLRKDQSAVHVACSAGPVEVAGRRSGSIIIARDVTERQNSERALIASEAKYRTLVEAMPQLVWSTRNDGHFDYFSKQWMDYTGQSQAEWLNFDYLSVVHPEDRETTRQAWQSAQSNQGSYDVEHRLRRFDGSWRWFKTRAVPLPVEEGRGRRWLGTCTDIDADRRAKAVLEQFNADLQSLAFAMAHDLHEPVRAVSTQMQLLARHMDKGLDLQGKAIVSGVIDNAAHMRQLLQDITLYSETVTRPLHIELLNLKDVVQSVLSRRRDKLEAAHAAVAFEVDPACLIEADRIFLRTIFDQLLDNAVAYRKPDTELSIKISSQLCGNEVVVALSDNGVGIKPEYHERIFQLFKRLHKQIEHPGSGIGLAMCKKILERHGKSMWVKSESEGGAVFYFALQAASSMRKEIHELAAS